MLFGVFDLCVFMCFLFVFVYDLFLECLNKHKQKTHKNAQIKNTKQHVNTTTTTQQKQTQNTNKKKQTKTIQTI
jgi:hypothetical protein